MQAFFVQKKTVIIEVAILIAVLAGGYYLYTQFTTQDVTTVAASPNEQLLGQNFIMFIKAVDQENLSFKNRNFFDSELVQQLQDYSETIGINPTRGRTDPFSPYAFTGSLR